MSRSARIAVLLSLGIHAALAAGVLAGVPAAPRVVLAAIVLLLVPGFALLRLLGASPPGGAALSSGWALGLGVAWNAVLLSITVLARVPFPSLTIVTLPLNAALWAVAFTRAARPTSAAVTHPAASAEGRAAPLGGIALAFVLLAGLLAALHAARLGAPMTYLTDSPDHIGTIRRMLEHRTLFPADAFFRGAGTAGVDPRKFLWHGEVALITRLAEVEPMIAWRNLPILLSPLLILNAAAFGMLVSGPAGAAIAAWMMLLTYGGSLAGTALRESVFAAKLADQLSLAATVALVADLATRSRISRLSVIGIALGAVAAHVFAAFQLALVAVALAIGLAFRDRGWSPALRRLAGTALAIGAAMLPFVLWQVLRTPPAVNPIHTAPQGLLTLWDRTRVVSPGVLWDWMGPAWLLIPILVPRVWRAARPRDERMARPDAAEDGSATGAAASLAALAVLTTSAAVATMLFLPPIVSALEPHVGYLLMRIVWMTPLAAFTACALPRILEQARTGIGRVRRLAIAELTLVAALIAPAVLDAVRVMRDANAIAADEARRSPMLWQVDLDWLDRHLPAGSVVLSDPLTSYAVPMLTREHVVTLLDQHSSPSDPYAVRRLLDARDALDPFGDWSRLREVVARYGVETIVLNRRFTEAPVLSYWAPGAHWFDAARARLERAGPAFERIYARSDFAIYRVHRAALGSPLPAPSPRPFVSHAPREVQGIARRSAPGMPGFIALALAPRIAAPGDTVRGVIVWRALARLPAGSYQVAVRFDRALPGEFTPPGWIAKPVRKLIERLRRERYRFRADHLPVEGQYGVDLWTPDEAVRDSFSFVVPADVADGDYRVGVRMLSQPQYPNFRLSDYFMDEDSYSGLVVGLFGVRRPRSANRDGEHRR